MTCRKCKFLDVLPNKAGKIVPRKTNAYQCKAEVPPIEALKLPASITTIYGFNWPPRKSWMGVDGGINCPTFQERAK